MADPFVAEIRIFAFNFAPRGWAFCDGQLLPIQQNTALFSLLGTTYGGDGRSIFGLPDLQGRAPMHPEQGPGLSLHDLGESGGTETVTLLQSEIPNHSHTVRASSYSADYPLPATGVVLCQVPEYKNFRPAADAPQAQFADQALTPAGGNAPHNNMMPYLTLSFCIALQGVFPPRS